ncbi:DUF7322 domain-containing protein [Natrinema versiforme]|uniref:DUF7322 domain-containing protein n=1 Tax=Natrinema versiforme TaxID=88724 RepID=UPI000677E248|nr:hypothetical protein [Natrinema versiforme]
MVFDPFEDESEDWEPDDPYDDPEDAFEDPDDDSLTIPSVDTEDLAAEADEESSPNSVDVPAVTTDETEAPNDLLEAFWVLIIVINGALLALALGVLFLLFEGDTTTGGWLLVIGLVLSGFAARRYWQYQHTAFETDPPTDSEPTDESETAIEPAPADESNTADDPTHS